MGNRMKKVSVVLSLIVLMLLLQFPMPAIAAQGQNITFSSDAITTQKGESIILPIAVSSDAVIDIGGLVLSIDYKTDCLSYVDGSFESTVIDVMGDCLVYNDTTKGVVTFAWTATDNATLSKNTILFKPSFEVLQTSAVDASVDVIISEAYKYKGSSSVQIEDFLIGNQGVRPFEFGVSITVGTDSMVDKVIALIDNIGTVEYSKDCLEKILEAASAYSILTEKQQKNVTNYNKLSEAMVEYEAQKLKAEGEKVALEISQYMLIHSEALALGTDTVTISDKDKVTNALDGYGKLSAQAQSDTTLFKYIRTLKNLLKQIEVLEKEAADKEAADKLAEEQRAEAKEYAAQFKKDYEYFLNLKAEELTVDHYTGLDAAVSQLNMLKGINPYVQEYLKAEDILLNSFYDIVQEMMKNSGETEENASQLAADNFRNTFAYILSLKPEDVTADDALEIRVADALYGMLDPDAQELLAEDYALIEELLAAVDNLPEDEDSNGAGDDDESNESTTINKVITNRGLEGLMMRFANRRIGVVVLILFLLLALSLIIFIALQLFYHLYYKKGHKSEKEQRKETIYDSSK